ncbi:hypothetical protein [Coraliomargarita parva]|uniref:hypothetical protein n=1 Tax=Coraliomargarita parva TaxID=3014050 RepID=UPI0022B4BB09|nr:hypothetical protein [Coraliomargarita parva]
MKDELTQNIEYAQEELKRLHRIRLHAALTAGIMGGFFIFLGISSSARTNPTFAAQSVLYLGIAIALFFALRCYATHQAILSERSFLESLESKSQ